MNLVIDVHCHTFNADDVPVRGFLRRVAFHDSDLGDTIAELVDLAIQGKAPGYRSEKAVLDQLLGANADQAMYGLESPYYGSDVVAALEHEVDDTLIALEGSNPAVLARIGTDLVAIEEVEHGFCPEVFADLRARAIRRAVKWVRLFGKTRLDITRVLLDSFTIPVDLFCPLLVDLGSGLGDTAVTTPREQVELQEKISRLSMLGKLSRKNDSRVHPFVGFDPRREFRARLSKDVETPLEIVRTAITKYGFVGIKMYPPMGWRPIGNMASRDMTAAEAIGLDEILHELYEWCVTEDVPLTAHCNDSNYAHESYRSFASPENWVAVLRKYPSLRLNLGHFGGARKLEDDSGWPWMIARAARDYPHLYADVGNHRVYDASVTDPYLEMLAEMFDRPETASIKGRIMLGSDWYMVAIHPRYEHFLEDYSRVYAGRFGDEAAATFVGQAARSFLGFDEAHNRNTQRLVARYQAIAPDRSPGWLAR